MGAVRTKSAAIINIMVVVAIIIVINLLSLNIFARYDMTENKIYSISDASKKIIGNLNDKLTVKAFFSEDLPAPHNTDRRYVEDILADFQAFSGGKMEYEFLDPMKEENKEEATSYRLQPVRFDVLGSTKAEYILGYKALVLVYGGKHETIPFINNVDDFEYNFVRLIKKLERSQSPRIGFANGFGESAIAGDLTVANQILGEDFEIVPINLNTAPAIPDDVQALFIVGPKKEYSQRALYLIDQYIMRGGRVGFFLDSYEINQQVGTITEINTGLDSLLSFYGVGIDKDYVIDKSCYRYTDLRRVEGGFVPVNIEVPISLDVRNFNKENLVTKYQTNLALFGASSLDTTMQPPAGVVREILFTSSEKAGSLSGSLQAKLQSIQDSDYNRSRIPLAAVLAGRFKSYFANRPVPQAAAGDTTFVEPAGEKLSQGAEDSRLLVIGNANFFDDTAARDRSGRFRPNFTFFRNLSDWLAQDDDLIAIRSKGNIYAPFTKMISDKTQTAVKLINILAMPIVIIIFGLVRWQMKRSSKRRMTL